MAAYDIRPLQLKVLDILKAVDETCRRHNLRYYIMAGTMLGAVRHGGFIPWDDDLDIGMPRRDYDLLMQHSHEWLPAPYEAVCWENDKQYPKPFAKIQDSSTTLIERFYLRYLGGIYLDVFPLDGAPESNWARRIHFMRYSYYKKLIYFVFRDPFKHGHGPSCWIPWLSQQLYSRNFVQRRMRSLMTAYDFDKSKFVVDHDDGRRGIMPREVIGEPTPVKFESETVMGLAQPHRYLTQKYGDYMVVPPHDKQRQHHFHYLNLNRSYRDYVPGEEFEQK